MEKKSLKKLSLKKVTILNFEEANQLVGGGLLGADSYSTDADNCSSKPGRDDSCTRCLTNEPTCPVTCVLC